MDKLYWIGVIGAILIVGIGWMIMDASVEKSKAACDFLDRLGYDNDYRPFPDGRCYVEGVYIADMDGALQFHEIQQILEGR